MKIGIIGIGDIAKKAYLPVMTRKKGIEIILCSRNENQLQELTEIYHGLKFVTHVKALIAEQIDAAFVHAATEAHYEICKELLEAGIHVYVDKPISNHADKASQLFQLAKEKDLILRVGFNRREAPLINNLKELDKPDVVICQKNRIALPSNIRTVIFDDFIHVVDTLRFLFEDNIISYQVKGTVKDNLLYSVTLQLIGKRGTAIGIMHRDSGRNEERLEFICPGEKRIIEDLNNLTIYKEGKEIRHKFDDWESVLYRRGFVQITDRFLKDVKEANAFINQDEDSLVTHEICEAIVLQLEENNRNTKL
jgi:virulence factor